MNTPETKPSGLALKLAEVMAAVERIPKNGHNAFHNYAYALEADVSDALRRELASRNVILLPSVHTIQRDPVGDKGSVVSTLIMSMTFMDAETGETITRDWIGSGSDKEDKGTYKAITGGVKYFLMKTFLIPTGDDPERDDSHAGAQTYRPATKTPPRPLSAPKKAIPAPKPGPMATKDQIKRFLDQIQPVAEAATKWAFESGLIKADQTIYDMDDKHFPATKARADKILWDIQRLMDGPEPPEPPTGGWRDFVLPFGNHKGETLGGIAHNDSKYLFGLAMNYTVSTEYNGKPKRAETIAKDQALRDALDEAKAELFDQPAQ